jgi:hypothetical protein
MRIRIPLWVSLFLAPAYFCGAADTQWVLEKSTLTYRASHPLHQTVGVSRDARGKAICHERQCDFLIGVPVKSFDSGDSNRDLHMLQVTRGAEYPIISVRTRLPEQAAPSAMVKADLQIQFAGQTVEFKEISFELMRQGREIHVTGTIPATLTDFKIPPPSLLSIPIKNDIPIHVDAIWQEQ